MSKKKKKKEDPRIINWFNVHSGLNPQQRQLLKSHIHDVSGAIKHTPIIHNGKIFVPKHGSIFVYDINTGKEIEKTPYKGESQLNNLLKIKIQRFDLEEKIEKHEDKTKNQIGKIEKTEEEIKNVPATSFQKNRNQNINVYNPLIESRKKDFQEKEQQNKEFQIKPLGDEPTSLLTPPEAVGAGLSPSPSQNSGRNQSPQFSPEITPQPENKNIFDTINDPYRVDNKDDIYNSFNNPFDLEEETISLEKNESDVSPQKFQRLDPINSSFLESQEQAKKSRGKAEDVIDWSVGAGEKAANFQMQLGEDFAGKADEYNAGVDKNYDSALESFKENSGKSLETLIEEGKRIDEQIKNKEKNSLETNQKIDSDLAGRQDDIKNLFAESQQVEGKEENFLDNRERDKFIGDLIAEEQKTDYWKEKYKDLALEQAEETKNKYANFKAELKKNQGYSDAAREKSLAMYGQFGSPNYNELMRRAGSGGLDASNQSALVTAGSNALSGMGDFLGKVTSDEEKKRNYIENLVQNKLLQNKGISEDRRGLLDRKKDREISEGNAFGNIWRNADDLRKNYSDKTDDFIGKMTDKSMENNKAIGERGDKTNTGNFDLLKSRLNTQIDPSKILLGQTASNLAASNIAEKTAKAGLPQYMDGSLISQQNKAYENTVEHQEKLQKWKDDAEEKLINTIEKKDANNKDLFNVYIQQMQGIENLSAMGILNENSKQNIHINMEKSKAEIFRAYKEAELLAQQGYPQEGKKKLAKVIQSAIGAIMGGASAFATTGSPVMAGIGAVGGAANGYYGNQITNPVQVGRDSVEMLNSKEKDKYMMELMQKLVGS